MRAFTRREMLAVPAALLVSRSALAADDEFTALERAHGGRLGVAALDTGSGKRIAHRADERFAMCSTFKWLLAAAVLYRVDKGQEQLNRIISYSKTDLVFYSPVTEKHAGEGMSVVALCEAAVSQSDNTAANLLIASLGGPAGVTRFARRIGDPITRLDRVETAMNDVAPGDLSNTTTPDATLTDMREILLSDALSGASRGQLIQWLKNCQTGAYRLRAGLPSDWVEGDKTGTWDGENNEANDIAILWPQGRKPILVTAYYSVSREKGAARDAVLAGVGRIIARRFA
jgi:beta-lactamase class A